VEKMVWKKLGRTFCLPESGGGSSTHLQGPVAIALHDRVRVYLAARHGNGKSYPAFVDVALDDPTLVIDVHDQAIMSHGPRGTFDDDGIMPACALRVEQEIWLYYSGWNRRVTVPYHNTKGLAKSVDEGATFTRAFDGPLLDRTPFEPWMAVTPWVLRCGSLWKVWYVSGLSWVEIGGRVEPVYGIKYGESADGINWKRSGDLVIPQRHAEEAIARPSVIEVGGVYHMWYCYRDSVDFRDGAGSYRIGYSFSPNGRDWQRADHLAGIDCSAQGWDSKMLCYPYVLQSRGRFYLFYNGNSFGQTGFGCAVWQGDMPSP
jgi:hypothetical protein